MNAFFRTATVLLTACFLPASGRGADSLCGTLADAFAADAAGLVREWVVQVPFDSSASRLEQVVVGNGLVVAQSGDGVVTAIAAASQGNPPVPPGTVLWSHQFGRIGRTIVPAAIGPAVVAVADDHAIVGIDRATGQVAWREPIGFPLVTGATASGDWFYAPLDGNGVLRLATNPLKPQVVMPVEPKPGAKRKRGRKNDRRLSESVEPRFIDAGGLITLPPIAYANGAGWCTSDGEVIVLIRDEIEWKREEFSLGAAPAGPLAARDGLIFATTTAGDVAAIELTKFGLRTKWHTRLEEAPAATAVFAGPVLVIPISGGGAVALDAATGDRRWRCDTAHTLLAADATRLWCIDATGRLALVDAATGERMAWFCTGPFTLPIVNTATDRLLLASPKGVVASLVPRPAPAVTERDAPAPASADPVATPPAADRRADDPTE